MRPTPTLHHAATGRPTEPPAHHLGMAATVDDRDALVRADLIDTATHAGLRCVALVLGLATTHAQWEAVAKDLRRAKLVYGSNVSVSTRRTRPRRRWRSGASTARSSTSRTGAA